MRHELASMLSLGVFLIAASTGGEAKLEQEDQRVGYSIGYQVGGDFRRQGLSVNPEIVVRGMVDALAGSEPLMTEDEMERALVRLQGEARAARERQRRELGQRNLAEGAAFLAENATLDGVRTLPSGLQYRILDEGSGRIPGATDTVTVRYRGTLIDGTEFDSSYDSGGPATFGIDGVIPGWSEALQLMKEGSRWRLFVPPDLGYAERATGRVGPNSTLIFDVELISVDTVR